MLGRREVREMVFSWHSVTNGCHHLKMLNVFLLTAFAEFVAHQISIHTRAQEMVDENAKLKVNQPTKHKLFTLKCAIIISLSIRGVLVPLLQSENEANEIKLKHAR